MYKEFSALLDAYITDSHDIRFNPIRNDIVVPIGTSIDHTYMESIVGNMLIYGGVGSGKTNLLTNIVEFLAMWYHPNALDIALISRYSRESLYTLDDKGEPILRNVVPYTSVDDIGDYLRQTAAAINTKTKDSSSQHVTVIAIDNLRNLSDISGAMNNLKYIMANGPEYGIYVIVTADPFVGADFVAQYAKHLIVLRCDETLYQYLKHDKPLVELPSATGYATVYGENVQTVCSVPMGFTASTRKNFFRCADAGHALEPRKKLDPVIF